MCVCYIKEKDSDRELYEIDGEINNNIFTDLFLKIVVIIKDIFNIITIKKIYNGYIFLIKYKIKNNKYYLRKNKKIIKKINNNIQKFKIDTIVLADDIKKKENFINLLINENFVSNKIKILNGKGIFPYLLLETVMYILKIQNKRSELEDIYILIDNNNELCLKYIYMFSKNFKMVNVVTSNINKYKKLEEKIFNEDETVITVTNNRKKSLKRAKIIINIDFEAEKLKKYNINRKAIIINVEKDIFNNSNIFDGININNLDINISQELKNFFDEYNLLNKTSLTILYESILNKKDSFENIKERIKKDEVSIIRLIGNNGTIDEKEYLRVI